MHPSLQQCHDCSSYAPLSQRACLNCGAELQAPSNTREGSSLFQRSLKGTMKVGGLALVSMTLSACYGGGDDFRILDGWAGSENVYSERDQGVELDQDIVPEMDLHLPDPPETCTDPTLDLDEDGYCGSQDCDETDPFKHSQCPSDMMDGEPMDEPMAGVASTGGGEAGAEATGGSSAGVEAAGGSDAGVEILSGSEAGAEAVGGSEAGAGMQAGQAG